MTTRLAGAPIDILLVEDNEGDARLAREALRDSKVFNRLHHVTDGEAAMAFLRRESPHVGVPRPDLILLDLNLPKKDSLEVLSEVKCDDDLKRIPVIVLTVSSAEEDIVRTYNLHANCFITKPIGLAQFLEIVRAVEDFWLNTVTLPPAP